MKKLILGLGLCLIATLAYAQSAVQVFTGVGAFPHPVSSTNPFFVEMAGTLPLPTGAATAANQTNGSQQTQVVGTVPLPTGAATAANQEVTVAGTSATSAQAVQGVNGGVPLTVTAAGAATAANQTNGSQVTQAITTPGTRTIVPLDVAAITTGGTAVTALAAGHAKAGGVLVTANAAGICVDQVTTAGTVTGTPSTTMCVPENVVFTLVPSAGAVSVNSTAAAAIGGEGLN